MGGSLEYSELEEIWTNYPALRPLCRLFLETGTYKGHTTRIMSHHFDRVITTEIMPPLYEESKAASAAEGITNIDYYLGDSVKILATLKLNQSAVFFIDAHISGEDSGFNGDKLVPLLDELGVILTYNSQPSVYIIDDCRFFGDQRGPELGAWDWAGITQQTVLDVFAKNGRDVVESYLKNDRMWVITSST